jgi:hypothetical protein
MNADKTSNIKIQTSKGVRAVRLKLLSAASRLTGFWNSDMA